MTDFKTSETAKNLMRAFAGESQARNRYTFAAGLAKEQKMPMVEAVFRYTADQEKEHAEIFYDYLKPLDKETIFIDGGYPVDLEKNTLAQLNAHTTNTRSMTWCTNPLETLRRRKAFPRLQQPSA